MKTIVLVKCLFHLDVLDGTIYVYDDDDLPECFNSTLHNLCEDTLVERCKQADAMREG